MNIDNTTTDDIIIPDESIDYLMLSLPNNKSQAIKSITDTYLAQLDPDEDHEPEKLAGDLIDIMKHEFRLHNQNASKDDRWPLPQTLEPVQIAELMLFNHKIKNISFAGMGSNREYDLLAVYQEFGENEGIYIPDQFELESLIRRYHYNIKTKDINEVISVLKGKAERAERCSERDLIAVNNGIFDYKNKILLPFSPDFVFVAKSCVNYNPGAVSPVIHNDDDGTDWEVEQWVRELFEDGSDIPETIWQIMGAIIRPGVSWNRASWFVSNVGCNGKGSLCHLMRNLAGKGACASIPLADFGRDFMLEPLINATSIVVDENDVGIYIEKAAVLKAVITGDVFQLNRKHKTPISYQFKGFMVQCINDETTCVKDRQLFQKADFHSIQQKLYPCRTKIHQRRLPEPD